MIAEPRLYKNGGKKRKKREVCLRTNRAAGKIMLSASDSVIGQFGYCHVTKMVDSSFKNGVWSMVQV